MVSRGGLPADLPLKNHKNKIILSQNVLFIQNGSISMRKRKTKGFTLIELLVVIAIIGILGALAASMYGRSHIAKARMTETINSMSVVASAVTAYYQDNSNFPVNVPVDMIKSSLGISLPDWNSRARFSDMNVMNGVITSTIARINSDVNSRTLVLSPTTTANGAIEWSWDVTSSTIPFFYIPKR